MASAILIAIPLAASAQSAAPPASSQGPMTVERVQSGFLVAPEVKVTEFDHRVSELVGGYAGWLTDQTFFIGGGGYWLANGSRDRHLAYAGVVFGVMTRGDRRVGFAAKGLVGAGRATLTRSIGFDDRDRGDIRVLPPVPSSPVVTFRAREDFLVAEPEADIVVGLTKHMRLTAGASYRFAGAPERRLRRDGLSGASAGVSLQIGSGLNFGSRK